jgi:hypothetical protein
MFTISVLSLGNPVDVAAKTVTLKTRILRHTNNKTFLVVFIVYLLKVFLSAPAERVVAQIYTVLFLTSRARR